MTTPQQEDNSLVIFVKKHIDTGYPCAAMGSDLAGEDGMFDRHKINGTYMRFQPGQEIPSQMIPTNEEVEKGKDPHSAKQLIEAWIAAHGEDA